MSYGFINPAKDHRLRLLVKTGLTGDHSFADIPCDIIDNGPDQNYPGTENPAHPTTSFAGRILAVGLAAYEWNIGGENEKQSQLERFTSNCIGYLK